MPLKNILVFIILNLGISFIGNTQTDSIKKKNYTFISRLKIELEPSAEYEIIVSRERVSNFKLWLDK